MYKKIARALRRLATMAEHYREKWEASRGNEANGKEEKIKLPSYMINSAPPILTDLSKESNKSKDISGMFEARLQNKKRRRSGMRSSSMQDKEERRPGKRSRRRRASV
eukprot:CAMPEP_0170188242 /NCGR_PEP_ID=MMETSP0040_2-20121228/43867_1 /TAXON_ID=641309 /ORGANISM="Lotharella oceanica, Strain CCMP622" /LENGTH=107 /DNA_ID=CAMNT_0010435493 /DNA_START=28 /DNA_END=351 /DNA_ORIENTATION=+